MQYKTLLDYLVNYALMNAIRNVRNGLGKLLNGLKNFRVNKMLDPQTSLEETKVTTFAKRIGDVSADNVALVGHYHPEYYMKSDTVEAAYSLEVDGEFIEPSGLAPFNHDHGDVYVRPGEVYIATNKLGGKTASQFAAADHEHDEYLRKDEIPVATDMIQGASAYSFASINHDHQGQYYSFNEPVKNAQFVYNPSSYELFGPEDFAKANHQHPNYFTQEQAIRTFKEAAAPYHYTKSFPVDVYEVNYDGADIEVNPDNAAYDLLQSPFAELGFKPEAKVVNATLVKKGTFNAAFFNAGDFAVNVGDYYTIELTAPQIKRILSVFPTFTAVPATDKAPNQMPVFIGWSGKTLVIHGLGFWGIPRQTITGKLLVLAEIATEPSNLPDCPTPQIGYAPIYQGARKYLCPLKKSVTIPIRYSAFPALSQDVQVTITEPDENTTTTKKKLNETVNINCRLEGTYKVELVAKNEWTSKDVITVECKKFELPKPVVETRTLIFKPSETKVLRIFVPDQVKQFEPDVVPSTPLAPNYVMSTTRNYDNGKMGWVIELNIRAQGTTNSLDSYILTVKDNVTEQTQQLPITLVTKTAFAQDIPTNLLESYTFEGDTSKKLFIPLNPLVDSIENAFFDFDATPRHVDARIIQVGSEFYLFAQNTTRLIQAQQEELRLRAANEQSAGIFSVTFKAF